MRAIGLLFLLAAAACSGDDEPTKPDRAACERFRDHVVELRLFGNTDPTHRANLRKAFGDDFVRDCMARTSRAELDCAMTSKDLASLQGCSPRR